MKSKKIILLLLVFLSLRLSAQTRKYPLNVARECYHNSQYKQAEDILLEYVYDNPNDVNGYWLYGWLAHDMKEKNKSEFYFWKALEIEPENEDIRIDFARTLFSSKKMKKAAEEFQKIIATSKNADYISEAHLMLSYIDFWKMDLKKSENHVDQILKINPGDYSALQQKSTLKQFSSPYIKLDLDYFKDDQPLSSFSEKVEVGMSRSKYLNFVFYIKNQNFNTDTQMIMANLKNTFTLDASGTSVILSAGISKHFQDKYNWYGELELKKKIADKLFFKTGLNRLPYLYTERSTYASFVESNFYGIIDYDHPGLFTGNFIYQYKFFKNNHINTIGAWLMTKYFNLSPLWIRGGYAVSYSDAKKSMYVPEIPINENVTGEALPGVYDFYFTPNNQLIHSLVGALKININNNLAFHISGNYGIYAKRNTPLLFMVENSGIDYSVLRTFYKEKFHPYNLKVNFEYAISEKLNIGGYYQYNKTPFYGQNKAGVQLFHKF